MNMQPLIFILLFGGVQGVLLLLFFIHKKLYYSAYLFLLLYLGVMLLQLSFKIMSKIWLMTNWPVIYSFSHWLPLLYGPLIYLFVKHLLQSRSSRFKELLHFIPAIAALTTMFLDEAGLLPGSIAMVIFDPNLRLVILAASVVSYHALAFSMLKQHRLVMKNYFSDSRFLQLNWVKQFITISAVACLAVVVALYLLYIYYPRGHEYRYGFVVLSICIYWFSYSALTKPFVFSVIKGYAKEDAEKGYQVPPLKVYKPVVKYANSTLGDGEAAQICTSLERIMTEKKLYLQAELAIGQLADELSCSRHHLSQVLNEKIGRSYYDYINCLRVEEAKQLLHDPKYHQHKIAAIAYDAGFNSLSAFNDVFKKYTGKTPSAFRKETLKELRQQRV